MERFSKKQVVAVFQALGLTVLVLSILFSYLMELPSLQAKSLSS
jgi:hypothetical protein